MMTLAHWLTQHKSGGFPVEKPALGSSYPSALHVGSNQRSRAKGKTSLAAIRAVHRHVVDALNGAGNLFDAFYYCLHHPHGIIPEYSARCECRKPSPYFLRQAEAQFDRETDVLRGRATGVRTVRVAADHPLRWARQGYRRRQNRP